MIKGWHFWYIKNSI